MFAHADDIQRSPALVEAVVEGGLRLFRDPDKQARMQAGYLFAMFRDRRAIDFFVTALGDPEESVCLGAAFALQTRDISYVVVTPNSVPAPGTPTEADIRKFYQDHIDRLTVPELRQASLIVFNTSSFSNDVKVDDATLQQAYQRELEVAEPDPFFAPIQTFAVSLHTMALTSAASMRVPAIAGWIAGPKLTVSHWCTRCPCGWAA